MTGEEDREFVVVHIAGGAHELEQIVDDLKAFGLTPARLDTPGSNIVTAVTGEFRVRIAVPKEEVAAAKTVIADHIARGIPGSIRYARALRRQLFLTLALIVVVGVAAWPFADGLAEVASIAGISGAAFFLLAGRIPPLRRWFEGE